MKSQIIYTILKLEVYFKDILIFKSSLIFNKSKIISTYLNVIRKSYGFKTLSKLSDKELLSGMVIKELNKPNSFPKYNNEIPFKYKNMYNPIIEHIQWNGYNWEYKLKNIGHKTDFISELNFN